MFILTSRLRLQTREIMSCIKLLERGHNRVRMLDVLHKHLIYSVVCLRLSITAKANADPQPMSGQALY